MTRTLFRCFLRVTKLGRHELENRVGERDDVRAAVAAISELSIDRLRNDPNTAAIPRLRFRAWCIAGPHPAWRMMQNACHPKKTANTALIGAALQGDLQAMAPFATPEPENLTPRCNCELEFAFRLQARSDLRT